LWFQHVAIVVRDMDAAWAQLRKHHIRQISPRPQTIPVSNRAAAGIKAIKFRDPDGHNVELLWFPEGKGDPRWHRPGPELFLGIDHTALTVRNTQNSIKFYRGLLGLPVTGETVNMGTEQEQLDNLPGVRARITGLAPPIGPPGVEFLEYELPTAGRPFPADSHPTDLMALADDTGSARHRSRGVWPDGPRSDDFDGSRLASGQKSRIQKRDPGTRS
ncbi:MAG: VOC family protein, partial [Nitrospiraceae bacterium]